MAAARLREKIRTKPYLKDLAGGDCLCNYCGAKCCKYFALPIEKPDDWTDFEFMRWFLLHERATVFVEDGDWYLLVHNRCTRLGDDNRCMEYETRPDICRDYVTDNCEYEDHWVYDHYFELPEQVEEYAEAVLGPKKGRDIRSRRTKK